MTSTKPSMPSHHRSKRRAVWAWRTVVMVVVVGFGLLGLAPLAPPSATPATADTEVFSAERALRDVAQIAREPHPIGSAANEDVRDYLVQELRAMGLSPRLQTKTAPDYFGLGGGNVDVVNVAARIEGASSTGAVALVAHYDTAPRTPGANDNAAGVGAILETARVVLSGEGMRNDVILLFTDGEEPPPRFGASAFAQDHPWAGEIGMIVNFEALGRSGPSVLIETSKPNAWLIDALAAADPSPAAFSFVTGLVDVMGGADTDFAPFAARGTPGVNFAYLRQSPVYHTPDDNAEAVDLRSLQHHGEHALALVRHFGAADWSALRQGGSDVFFTVGPAWVVRYSESLTPLVAIGTALLLALAATRSRRPSIRSVAGGAGLFLGALLAAGLLAALAWRVVTSVRPSPGIAESYAYLAVMLTIVAAAARRVRIAAVRRGADWASGVVVAWVAFGLATGLAIPAMSYVFTWPALCGVVALWAGRWLGAARARRLAMLALVAAPSLILAIPAVDTLFQLAQPRPGNLDSQVVEVMGLVVLMGVLVIELLLVPLHSPLPDRRFEPAGARVGTDEVALPVG